MVLPTATDVRVYVTNKHKTILNTTNEDNPSADNSGSDKGLYEWYNSSQIKPDEGTGYMAHYYRAKTNTTTANLNILRYASASNVVIKFSNLTSSIGGTSKDSLLALRVNSATYAELSGDEQDKTYWVSDDTVTEGLIMLDPTDGYYGKFTLTYYVEDTSDTSEGTYTATFYVIPFATLRVKDSDVTIADRYKVNTTPSFNINFTANYDDDDIDPFTGEETNIKKYIRLKTRADIKLTDTLTKLSTFKLNGGTTSTFATISAGNSTYKYFAWNGTGTIKIVLTLTNEGSHLFNASFATCTQSFSGTAATLTITAIKTYVYLSVTDLFNNIDVTGTTATGTLTATNATVTNLTVTNLTVTSSSVTDVSVFDLPIIKSVSATEDLDLVDDSAYAQSCIVVVHNTGTSIITIRTTNVSTNYPLSTLESISDIVDTQIYVEPDVASVTIATGKKRIFTRTLFTPTVWEPSDQFD